MYACVDDEHDEQSELECCTGKRTRELDISSYGLRRYFKNVRAVELALYRPTSLGKKAPPFTGEDRFQDWLPALIRTESMDCDLMQDIHEWVISAIGLGLVTYCFGLTRRHSSMVSCKRA